MQRFTHDHEQRQALCPALLAALLVLLATSAAGQQVVHGSHDELAFDDDAPNVVLPTISYPLPQALAVRFGILGAGHLRAIVVGGNTQPSVRVYPLDSSWAPIEGAVQEPPLPATYLCYDLDFADLNGDAIDDLVVGRRLSPPDVAPYAPPGWRDMVLLNGDPAWEDGLPSGPYFSDAPGRAHKLQPDPLLELSDLERQSGLTLNGQVDPATWVSRHRQTHSVTTGDIDLDGDLDLVCTGIDYGMRLFDGHGDGTFTHLRTYVDEDFASYAQLSGDVTDATLVDYGFHRSALLVDLDADGDLDLVSARTTDRSEGQCGRAVRARPDRVWFNQAHGGGQSDDDPFVRSPQADGLRRPPVRPITWRLVDLASGAAYEPQGPGDILAPSGAHVPDQSTFEFVASDLDLDGDLDLAAAHPRSQACAYLNNGYAGFGSLNRPRLDLPLNDGLPAHLFPSLTPGWSGPSDCVRDTLIYLEGEAGCTTLPVAADHGAPGFGYVFDLAGPTIDRNTGVAVGDLNGDGLDDLAFSNRGDFEEICKSVGYGYFNADEDAPPCFDTVFFNTTAPGSCLSFHPVVELLSEANDGTGYGELIDVNSDGQLDWLDANFSNTENGGDNRLFWGLPFTTQPALWACGEAGIHAIAQGPERLVLGFGPRLAHAEVVLFASPPSLPPAIPAAAPGGAIRDLDALVEGLGRLLPPGVGGPDHLDAQGRASLELRLPDELPGAWLTAVAVRDGHALAVSNAVRLGPLP